MINSQALQGEVEVTEEEMITEAGKGWKNKKGLYQAMFNKMVSAITRD